MYLLCERKSVAMVAVRWVAWWVRCVHVLSNVSPIHHFDDFISMAEMRCREPREHTLATMYSPPPTKIVKLPGYFQPIS